MPFYKMPNLNYGTFSLLYHFKDFYKYKYYIDKLT